MSLICQDKSAWVDHVIPLIQTNPAAGERTEEEKGISMIFQCEVDLSTNSFRVLLSAALRTHQAWLRRFYNPSQWIFYPKTQWVEHNHYVLLNCEWFNRLAAEEKISWLTDNKSALYRNDWSYSKTITFPSHTPLLCCLHFSDTVWIKVSEWQNWVTWIEDIKYSRHKVKNAWPE